ncbi:Cobalamin biosynthesis protein [Desulfonema limicola]|uniref:Cobalamin biosynthesis protein CobD n=1 Tax=Desulfonema limicola TaxID=45656 RepID=A0A975BBZ6_9BACT|nr:adenosylcobinamide-phosphate synthase CbiB [Desulfonema limicola]QTA82460.1 Cobalamin biosynthesis protein [Desulfonema limicola]
MFFSAWYVLPSAFLLDFIFGDPDFSFHPIRCMGKAIDSLEPVFRKFPLSLTISGGVFAICLISGIWLLTFFLVKTAGFFYPPLKAFLEIIIIYFCIAPHSLEKAGMEIYRILKQNNLPEARQKLSMIVGRDVTKLSETGAARAAVETVAENLSDGVIAPLFFAALGGAPLIMAYKMINTLDSMIGYKNEKYINFGRIAARIDDIANYIPARISVFLIALAAQILSQKGKAALKTAKLEGNKHTSPNAGYPEAAFAGALGIRLGGPNIYHGTRVEKPYIGKWFAEVKVEDIKKACDLMFLSSFLWFALVWAGTALLFL